MEITGRYVDFEDNTAAREKTGKKVPDNIVLRVKGKEFKIGTWDGKPAELEDADGKEIMVPTYHDNKNGREYYSLNKFAKIEVTGAGKAKVKEEEEPVPEDADAESDAAAADEPKVNMAKVNYRNYLITQFGQCYQDAMLAAQETHKTDGAQVSREELLQIACALFQKSAATEIEYKKK